MTQAMHGQDDCPIWRSADRWRRTQSLQGEHTADIVVIGGGLAGLAIAYFANVFRPDLSVMVLEAERIGTGATGRSTGVASHGVSMPLVTLRRKYGDSVAANAFNASIHGVSRLRELIAAESIECDAETDAYTVAAISAKEHRGMLTHLKHLGELGCQLPNWLSGDELVQAAGPGYIAGFSYPDALLLDPYKLLSGLVEVLARRKVPVFEYSRAISVVDRSSRPLVRTDSGRVRAGMVILATDGYSASLNPLQSSVIPVRTHLLATRPLEPTEVRELGWCGRGAVTDRRNFFNYYRMTADHRVLFGGGRVTVPSRDPDVDAAQSHAVQAGVQRELFRRFPSLSGSVTIDARWSGLTASSIDRLPVVGPARDRNGVYFAGSWCGHGFSLCTDVAWRFGRMLTADPAPMDLPWYRNSAKGIPTFAIRNIGTRTYLRALEAADYLTMICNKPATKPSVVASPDRSNRKIR